MQHTLRSIVAILLRQWRIAHFLVAFLVFAVIALKFLARFDLMGYRYTQGSDADPLGHYPEAWLSSSDVAHMVAMGCRTLFYRGDKRRSCSCGDEIIAGIASQHEDGSVTLLSDEDWRLVRDPKMDQMTGALGLHYTAWSMHSDLHTLADLRWKHIQALDTLLESGALAVARRHPEISAADVVLFSHFPPNIFRLHVHLVHVNASTWAPTHEIVYIVDVLHELRARHGHGELKPSIMQCRFWS